MFYKRQGYFYRLTKNFPFLKYFDFWDPQSFVREQFFDNLFVCMMVYGLFYFGLWYADKVIKKIEKINEEMFDVMEDNKTKLDDLITLKKKRVEYEEVVVKTKGVQRQTEKYLDNELEKLSVELTSTVNKLGDLEKVFEKCKSIGSTFNTGISTSGPDGECIEGVQYTAEKPEDIKVLEPSFPPPMPPEPPPRKYGIFVARPPGHRVTPGSGPPPTPPPPKIGFKLSSVC